MKKLLLMAVMALFMVGVSAQTKTVTPAKGVATITIKTNASKNCQKCNDRFKENVPFFKGVKEYTYDKATAQLTVTYDTKKTNPAQLRKNVSDLGYNADDVKANPQARAKLPACCRAEGSCGDAHTQTPATSVHKCQHPCSHGTPQTKAQGASKCQHPCQGATTGTPTQK